MPDRSQCHDQLHLLLSEELQCAVRLESLLTAEGEALTGRDIEPVERLVRDKQTLLQEFEALEARRHELVAAAGFAPDRAGLEACIAHCDSRGRLAHIWSELMARIRRCQHLNRRNGAVVDISRRHVQQTLTLLRGQSPATPLYSPAGSTTGTGIPGRTLAKA
ncbi:MAG: flagella synthesis protein FlgN [Pseudomonadota bacterium]